MAVELHELEHPRRIRAVAIALRFEKPLQRMLLGFLDVVRSGRVVVPLALDFVLVRVACLDLRDARVTRRSRNRRRECRPFGLVRVEEQIGPSRPPGRGPTPLPAPDLAGVLAQRERPEMGDMLTPRIEVDDGLS
jgi:hypothetical protein